MVKSVPSAAPTRRPPPAIAAMAPLPDGDQKWLVCGSAKGGVGKTTCALNLATLAAERGLEVALLDTDTQRTLTHWHARRPEEAPAIRLFTTPLRDVSRAIDQISAMGGIDLVLVDTPPGIDERPVEIRLLLQKADYVVVPCTQGSADVASVTEFMASLRREGVPSAFVLNCVQRTYRSYHEAKRNLNRAGDLCPLDVRRLEDIQSTHKLGVGINEMTRANGAEDFEAVWDYVAKGLGV